MLLTNNRCGCNIGIKWFIIIIIIFHISLQKCWMTLLGARQYGLPSDDHGNRSIFLSMQNWRVNYRPLPIKYYYCKAAPCSCLKDRKFQPDTEYLRSNMPRQLVWCYQCRITTMTTIHPISAIWKLKKIVIIARHPMSLCTHWEA